MSLWNIRKTVKKGDYLYAVVPEHPKANEHGYVLEHRVVAENMLGRMLDDKEDVHHINKDGRDNRPENLKVIGHGEHQRMHARERYPNGRTKVTLRCQNCGIEFQRVINHRPEITKTKNVFCSHRCNGFYNGYQKGQRLFPGRKRSNLQNEILLVLNSGDDQTTISGVARTICNHRPSVSRAIKKMRASGLIHGESLLLTEKGRDEIDKLI